MKRLIALSLVAGLLSSSLAIAEELLFPEESPVISLKLPKGWEAKSKSGFLYSGPADDEDYFVEFSELEATPDDGEAVMKEARTPLRIATGKWSMAKRRRPTSMTWGSSFWMPQVRTMMAR